ncbi:MAG TPA: lipoprotein-releasing ABC transporter permease subunit [Cellvibrionaceae bacterium]
MGLRYIRSKRRNQFISFVSGFSLLGMGFGVMALIVVMSVMNGFDREMKERILRVVPHGFVNWQAAPKQWPDVRQRLLTTPGVEAAAPYVSAFGLISQGNAIEGVNLQGIEPELQKTVSALADNMLLGALDDLRPGEFGIVMGALLARRLGVVPGDTVTLTLPEMQITPAGVYPRVKRFTVKGVFRVNAPVDQDFAMIHLQDAVRLLRQVQGAEGLQVKVDDIYSARDILQISQSRLGEGYELRDWSQTQGSLFQAVQMEKRVVAALLSIIVMVAAFNIISSLVLMVADKRADIAVLRTLGLSARQVMGVFVVQGFGVGVLGTLVGVIAGCLLALSVGSIVAYGEQLLGQQVFDPSVYFISQLPSQLYMSDVLTTALVALGLSFLATLYPAWRAAQIEPAEALRYE